MTQKFIWNLKSAMFVAIYCLCTRLEAAQENIREYQALTSLFNMALDTAGYILREAGSSEFEKGSDRAIKEIGRLLVSTEDSTENFTKIESSDWREEFSHIPSKQARAKLELILRRIKKRVDGVIQSGRSKFGKMRQEDTEIATKLIHAAVGKTAAGRLLAIINNSGVPASFAFKDGDVTAAAGYDTICKNAGTSVGEAIVFDMVCICAKKATATSEELCWVGAKSLDSDNGQTAAHVLARAGKLFGFAREGQSNVVSRATGEKLLAKLAEFRGLLGTNVVVNSPGGTTGIAHQNFILGHASGNADSAMDCTGTAATNGAVQGICVNYKSIFSKGNEIPWVAEIQEAAKKLMERNDDEQVLHALTERLETLTNLAKSSYDAALSESSREMSHSPLPNSLKQEPTKSEGINEKNPQTALQSRVACPSVPAGWLFAAALY